MNSNEIRDRFLKYFASKGHTVVKSSSLVPESDPTLLFTNAGMVQFKGVFLQEEKRPYTRAATCQKCMRAGGKHNDLENVGKTARHHTFFEMLGNFSFGDYFKEEAIEYAWEFLTEDMALPKEKLWVSVYEQDDEAEELWKAKTGVPAERIVRLGEQDNFWSMGDVGPCGPCSEVHLDQGPEAGCGKPSCGIDCDCGRYLEVWNLVFMQYNRDESGNLTELPSPCIDTGMGLERLAAVKQGKLSNYDTDLFIPIIEEIESLSGVQYGADPEKDVSIKAIADHARATVFLITDGVLPSNEGRGYVLRRIIRRAARHGRFLGLTEPFVHKVGEVVIDLMGGAYPELPGNRELISRATRSEEERFFETLERGLQLLDTEVEELKKTGETVLSGAFAFKLYDTYGFPVDLTEDIVSREGLKVDTEGFEAEMTSQRDRAREAGLAEAAGKKEEEGVLYSRLASEGVATEFAGYTMDAISSTVVKVIKDGREVERAVEGEKADVITARTPFYGESGGQVGDTGVIVGGDLTANVVDTKRPAPGIIVHRCEVKKGTIGVGETVELVIDVDRRKAAARNHTATHLLHSALRRVLGEHVRQAGSLVAPEALRFDFNHFEALTDDELARIEEEANRAVLENRPVSAEELPYDDAVKKGALAFFGEKYADVVRMVDVEDVSKELCGGTHVQRTGDIGLVKITSESSVASGVRRIEALTGVKALERVKENERLLRESAALLRSTPGELPGRIKKLLEAQKERDREIEKLKARDKAESAGDLMDRVREAGGVKVLATTVDAEGPKELRQMADTLRGKLKSGIVVLAAASDGKATLLAAVTKDLTEKFKAGELVKRIAPVVDGRGGGKPDMAQAGGKDTTKLGEALEEAMKAVEEMAAG